MSELRELSGRFIVQFNADSREEPMERRDTLVGNRSFWVVVADEFQASVYKRAKKFSELQLILELKNDIAREKLENLISDRGGRGFDSHGQGRHTYTKEKADPRAQSYQPFAREIAGYLRTSREHDDDGLVVVAAPRFLGILRAVLDKTGMQPDLTIDKEVTAKSATFVRELIDQHPRY
jgi:protein required for attachment to host cells